MITYVQGNLFDSGAEVLVNTVNLVGVMGKGLALQFKQRFPEMYEDYQRACRMKTIGVGHCHVWGQDSEVKPHAIINLPTKRHWRDLSRLADVEAGLKNLRLQLQQLGCRSVAMPIPGTGLGGLPQEQVIPLIERYLDDLPIEVLVYGSR